MSNQEASNELTLITLLRGSNPKPKSKIEQLRADLNDIRLGKRILTLVKG